MTSAKRTLIKYFYFFLLTFTFENVACNTDDPTKEANERTMKIYFANLLRNIDRVDIQFFELADTLTQTLTKQQQIDIFKEVINGKEDRHLKCDTTGRLIYYKRDTLLLEAYFSTPVTGSKYDVGVVTYFLKPDIYKTLFTYRAGMGIDEYFYNLTKPKFDTIKNNR
jgi:hypothetical protein